MLSIYNNKDKISSIEEIKDGDIIAIPSDLTNGGRALKLLEKAGILECDPAKGYVPTKADITKYNVNIEIMEAESATLANLLPDCTAAIINGGNAYTAGLSAAEDTIFTDHPALEVGLDAAGLKGGKLPGHRAGDAAVCELQRHIPLGCLVVEHLLDVLQPDNRLTPCVPNKQPFPPDEDGSAGKCPGGGQVPVHQGKQFLPRQTGRVGSELQADIPADISTIGPDKSPHSGKQQIPAAQNEE